MTSQQPAEPLLLKPPENSDDHHTDLSVETKERTAQLNAIRQMSWFNRVFRSIGKGSLRGVVVIFIRLTLGAGIFTLPHYVQCYGYALGALLIVAAGLLNIMSYFDIIEAAEEKKSTNYFDLINDYLGSKVLTFFKFTYFMDLSATVIGVFVVCYNLLQFCMGFLGMTQPDWYEDVNTGKWNESNPAVLKVRGLFFIVIFTLSIPFLLQKELFLLQKVNYLVIVSLVLMIGYSLAEMPFFWNAYSEVTTRKPIQEYHNDWFENFFALMLAFYAQPYVFSLKSELIYPTVQRMKKTTKITTGTEIFLFAVVGVLGYLAFGDMYTPEMFYARKPYDGKSPASEWVYRSLLIFFFACVLLGLAVYNPTIREAIYDLIPVSKKNKLFYVVSSITPFMLYATVAFLKPSVVFIFNFTGVSVSNFNGFILPAVIQAVRKKQAGNKVGMIWPLIKVTFFVIFGSIGMYFMVKKLVDGK